MEKAQDKLTMEQAAQLCGDLFGIRVTSATIWSWARRGVNGCTLRYTRAGRRLLTTQADLEAFHDALLRRDTEEVRHEG